MLHTQLDDSRIIAHHLHHAADIEVAYQALSRVGRRLGPADGVAGTVGRALLDTLQGLAELRGLLDLALVGAGYDPAASPYYPMRGMRPSAATRAAVREAIAATWPYPATEHDNIGRMHGRGAPPPVGGPPCPEGCRGDDDRPAALHEGPAQGATASGLAAHAPRVPCASHDDTASEGALTGPRAAI